MNRYDEIIELRLSGLSFAEIARRVGVSRQRVQQILAPPKHVRALVVERAQGKCQSCGVEVGKSGQVHHGAPEHRDGDWYNQPERLQLLCQPCHRSIHRAREMAGWSKVRIEEVEGGFAVIPEDPADADRIARAIAAAMAKAGVPVNFQDPLDAERAGIEVKQ